MLNINVQENLSLLLSIKYTYNKTEKFDYQKEPRPNHNFVFMLEGEGEILSNRQVITIKNGDILYIPKNTTYTATWMAKQRTVFHSIHFDFQAKIDPLFGKNIPVQKLDNTNFNTLYPLVEEISKTQFLKGEETFFTLSAFYRICGILLKNIRLNQSKPINKTILPAITYIEQNHTKSVTVEYLSSICFLSQSRFYYLFKKQTGLSPIEYKLKLSLQRSAKDLIYDLQSSISQIAEKHGFKGIVYFERAFKKFMGASPSQYRKQNALL